MPSAVVHVTDEGRSVVPDFVMVSSAVPVASEPRPVAGANWNVGLSAASVIVPMAALEALSGGGVPVLVGVPRVTVK